MQVDCRGIVESPFIIAAPGRECELVTVMPQLCRPSRISETDRGCFDILSAVEKNRSAGRLSTSDLFRQQSDKPKHERVAG